MKLLICVIVCIFINVFALDLPSYMPKCTISDPQFFVCLRESSNLALPFLLKGEEQIGLQSMSPLYLPSVNLQGKHLLISATDVNVHGLRNTIVTKNEFYLKKKHFRLDTALDVLSITGTYIISEGEILYRKVSGSGSFVMTFVGNHMDYNTDFYLYEKDDGNYIQFVNGTAKFSTKRIYYYFENLRSSHGDVNALINKEWRRGYNELAESLNKLIFLFFQIPTDAVSNNVPIENIFYS